MEPVIGQIVIGLFLGGIVGSAFVGFIIDRNKA